MAEQKLIFKQKPQINISYPSTGRMWLVSLCALLCVLQSALADNGQSLIVAATTVFSAVIIELLLTARQFGVSKIRDGSAVATALILSLLMPNQIHPVYSAFGAVFAIVIVKYSFGGLGSNWLNPALGGWLFIRFSWPSVFANAIENNALEMTVSGFSSIDNSATSFFNDTVFSLAGVQLPSGYVNLLFFNNPGMIVDRGLFTFLLGTVIITALGINRGWIPLVFLSVYGFLIRFAGDVPGIFWNGDLLYGIFSGGTAVAAFILSAEPASGAKLWQGVFFTVVLGAVLSWFFRYRCMEYTGCIIALALVNCLTPLIRLLEDKIFFSHKNNGVIPENLL
ncbi:MAG: RnfABCDGE type electron transport complex subunit D [Treponema sp.]|jgi:electron transport complex protein RnfD|nr:RnfABCDGE type electron transport complex subunit D [Treponema sp.]